MMNDTVREELQTKITAGASPAEIRQEKPPVSAPAVHSRAPSLPVVEKRVQTTGLSSPKTSPTLVEFQHKNTSVPDWRLQLQNAVQQRKGGQVRESDRPPLAVTNAPSELRTAAVSATVEQHIQNADPRVANAMRRIAESRKTFSEPAAVQKKAVPQRAQQSRPFGVVTMPAGTAAAVARTPIQETPKPRLVSPTAPEPPRRDTNKLPKIEIAPPSQGAKPSLVQSTVAEDIGEFAEIKRIQIKADSAVPEDVEWPTSESDEIEDLAPLGMRFGAGLFDIIIGAFAAMLILSPIAFAGNEWLNFSGFLTFAGTVAVVLFVYMTACLGFLGKTAGMKLFSLELVDATENEYPTLRQAATNSGVFLISVFFVGAGFIAMYFNEEKRALHDLLSGTIMVREF